jgi:hypothetical protein
MDFVEAQFAVDLAAHQAVALADDAAPAGATAHPLRLTAVWLSRLPLVRLPHQALAIARLLDLGLCRVLAARATDLRAVPTAGLSRRDELLRRVCHLQRAKATPVQRLRRGLLLRVVAAHLAWLFHVRRVPAKRLTKGPASPPAQRDRLRRLGEACLQDRDLHPLDLSQDRAPAPPPRERQHELVAVCSWDFQP